MKTCSLNDFMEELRPWLDGDHVHRARIDEHGHLVLHFLDGTKNVYQLDDCSRQQVEKVLADLKRHGIRVDTQE